MNTIFALATPPGKSGVAIIRVSGPEAFAAASQLNALPDRARTTSVRHLTSNGEHIDDALVLRFDAPNSFTGEDVVEFHVHGSRAIIASVAAALASVPGLRPADAGEFTRRALENDRLDLAQIEGLADLIDAETEAQRKLAMRVFSGAIGERVEEWRKKLIRAAALLEATIDFVDEDVPVDVFPEVRSLLVDVLGSLRLQLEGARASERLRSGFEVAIIGPPNSGKSTLLNTLAGRDAAITSEIAGTTRDVIEVQMDIGGLPVTLLDTAGLRETEDRVEAIGIARARARAQKADLRVVLDSGEADLGIAADLSLVAKDDDGSRGGVSGLTGAGVSELLKEIESRLSQMVSNNSVVIRQRHADAIRRAVEALGAVEDRLSASTESTEVIAEDLRTGIRALDSLVGRVDVEDLLDDIFASFCIGK